ncbi:hypothetical protein VST7929_01889 [Vibrio stylophorae]|uniref:DUF469 domain-containing protein n=1 Tax=Vibrio stylophorae TaxID=659351 RepID=A0ABM8ZUK3_9VIBR|nr:YggL family protein [Vibrio stylophorae]CAH0534007.1 hypothetical protein VST7929_01889 [Vibrio stylophorae]
MNLTRIDNKKRRIRKKLYMGEFAIQGFEIVCHTSVADFDQYDVFIDDFIDFLESIDLCFAGGGFEVFDGFICSTERYGSATQAQRDQVAAWLEARAEVSQVTTGELVDANYL